STAGVLSFTPAANASGSAIVSISLQDNGGTANGGVDSLATQTFTITVTAVNDAPIIDANGVLPPDIDGTATYSEAIGGPQPITTANLIVSDQENNNITSVVVTLGGATATESLAVDPTSLPTSFTQTYTAGTLTISGPTAAAPTAIEAMLQTLTYDNTSKNPGTSRTVSIVATDDGTPTAATSDPATQIAITITTVDDPPSIDPIIYPDDVLTVPEGGSNNITTHELSASDPDTAPANLVFTVTTLPVNGQLLKNGTALALNGTFTQADIAVGLLSYTHNGSETTSDSFTFNLSDGTTTISGRFDIIVTPVNNAPVITLTSGATPYLMGDPPVVIDSGATVSDSDSLDFNTGQLSVALTGGSTGDRLSVLNEGSGVGQIGVSGTSVLFGSTVIGTIISDGSYPTSLVITFNSSATPAVAQALARAITFSNLSASPTSGSRAATFTVSDGDGLTSAPASKQITINQPPVAVDDTVNVTINSIAQAIDVLANDSDPEDDTLTVTAVTQGSHGTVAVGAGGANVTYTPDANYIGADSFTYTISDGHGGSATATVRVTVHKAMMFLPFVTKPAYADLKGSISVNPASPEAGKQVRIEVTVTNQGDAPASNFWVDFYINPSQVPEVNDPWNEVCGVNPCFGLAWYYTGTLAPGQSIVFNSAPQSAGNPNGYKTDASNWLGYFANGTQKLYAIVDSWNRNTSNTARNPNGAIYERDETNNRAEQDIIVTLGTLPSMMQNQTTNAILPRN
ncbi:tandem-95 repeat protein, partial [Chloroflexales bacterium ZM16-3]|nr:tandem-95 repeat protein [Chloroflexales bacterium ZM16-3]